MKGTPVWMASTPADPERDLTATRYETLSFDDVIRAAEGDGHTSFTLCQENGLPTLSQHEKTGNLLEV
jgi:uridylate kinase